MLSRSTSNLASLAVQFSNDPMVSGNSGNLGWFEDGRMIASFNESIIDNPVGSIQVAETGYGYHVIYISGKKDFSKRVRVAIVQIEVIPSNITYQQIYAEASKLASENRSIEDFDAAVEENRLNKRTSSKVREMTNRIVGLNDPRQIVRWAFGKNQQVGEVEVGDVSNVFDLDDQFVVAVLTHKAEEGYPPSLLP